MRLAVAAFGCLALWACDGSDTEPASVPALNEEPLIAPVGVVGRAKDMQVSASGIGWVGSSGDATFNFGAPRVDVDKALTASFRTEPERLANDECGAGPLEFSRYSSAFTAIFQDGKFAGWSIDKASEIATPEGLSIGSPREMVVALRGYEPILQSSLGDEFTVTGISGIYGETGVDYLWAGANCIFR